MIQSTQACLDDLLRISSDQSSEARREALRRVTDLFIATSDLQSSADSAEFGETIGKFAQSTDEDSRAELSQRIAARPNTPRNLAVNLANDTIAVAQPVLEHAVNLTDDDLADIARKHGQSHMLAICKRLKIAPKVTDVLVEHGEEKILEAVAENRGAEFSENGISTLTRRGAQNMRVNEALLLREDYPDELKAEVRENVDSNFQREFENSRLGTSLSDMVDASGKSESNDVENIRVTFKKEIDLLHSSGNLQQDTIMRFSKARCKGSTAYAIGKLADLDLPTVYGCLFSGSPITLAVLSKSLGFSGATYWEIIEQRKSAGGLPGNFMVEARNALDSVDKQTAQRILRFLKVRKLATTH